MKSGSIDGLSTFILFLLILYPNYAIVICTGFRYALLYWVVGDHVGLAFFVIAWRVEIMIADRLNYDWIMSLINSFT